MQKIYKTYRNFCKDDKRFLVVSPRASHHEEITQ